MSEDTDMAISNAADRIVAAIEDASTGTPRMSEGAGLEEMLRTMFWSCREEEEPRNIVDALFEVTAAINKLTREVERLGFGNASNPEGIGAIEGLTMKLTAAIAESTETLEAAIEDVATQIETFAPPDPPHTPQT